MKAAAGLFVLASLFLVGCVYAGIPQDLAALQAQVNVLTIKSNVKEEMARYTYDFDRLMAVGAIVNGNASDPRFQAALDASVSHFCQGAGEFQGWFNYYGGAVAGNFTTLAQVRGDYAILAQYVLKNISDHRLSNEIVTVSADGQSAFYTGKLCHDTINAFAAVPGETPGPQWIKDCGHYENVFKVRSDLSVCISYFYDAGTYVVRALPQTVQVPAGATSITVPASVQIIGQDLAHIPPAP